MKKNHTHSKLISLFVLSLCLSIPFNSSSITKPFYSADCAIYLKKDFEKQHNLSDNKKVKKKKLGTRIKSFFDTLLKKQSKDKTDKKRLPTSSIIGAILLSISYLSLIIWLFSGLPLGLATVFIISLILSFFFAFGGIESVKKNPEKFNEKGVRNIWKWAWITVVSILGLFIFILISFNWNECCF